MPTVLVDTSCLIGLLRVDQLDVLRQLYDVVAITEEVRLEFARKNPVPLPDWLAFVEPLNKRLALDRELDAGEASLIQIANERHDCLLILDELKARNVARRMGLNVTGTIGILVEAKRQGLIPLLGPIFERLRQTDFRFSAKLERAALSAVGEIGNV